MQKIQKGILAISALLLCAQFSMDQDETSVSGGGKKSAVNFRGTIQDNTGKAFRASHINISGLYKQIPVYAKPQIMQDEDYNPSINMIRLDLAEVAQIEVPSPEDVHIFKNRKYILLHVYLNNNLQKSRSYLIDESKRIFCNQINGKDPIERELAFPAIQVIKISGYTKKAGPATPAQINTPNLKQLPLTPAAAKRPTMPPVQRQLVPAA